MRTQGTASSREGVGARPRPIVGIDLAGVETRETGVALLRGGHLVHLGKASTDLEVIAFALRAGRRGLVAINAPLTRPRGRCCLDDDCPCRHDPGTRSRQVERDLGRMGIPTLATALIKVLARRGRRIALTLRLAGIDPLEGLLPHASLRLLGLPAAGNADGRGTAGDPPGTPPPCFRPGSDRRLRARAGRGRLRPDGPPLGPGARPLPRRPGRGAHAHPRAEAGAGGPAMPGLIGGAAPVCCGRRERPATQKDPRHAYRTFDSALPPRRADPGRLRLGRRQGQERPGAVPGDLDL